MVREGSQVVREGLRGGGEGLTVEEGGANRRG